MRCLHWDFIRVMNSVSYWGVDRGLRFGGWGYIILIPLQWSCLWGERGNLSKGVHLMEAICRGLNFLQLSIKL